MGWTWWNLCNYVQSALALFSLSLSSAPTLGRFLPHGSSTPRGSARARHGAIGCHGNEQEATKELRVLSWRWRSHKAIAQEGQDKEKPICLLPLNTNSPSPLCQEMLMNRVFPQFKKPSPFQPDATTVGGWSILPSVLRSSPSGSASWHNISNEVIPKQFRRMCSLTYLISNPHVTRTAAAAADRSALLSEGVYLVLLHYEAVTLLSNSLDSARKNHLKTYIRRYDWQA